MITLIVSAIASVLGFLAGYFLISPVLGDWIGKLIEWITNLF